VADVATILAGGGGLLIGLTVGLALSRRRLGDSARREHRLEQERLHAVARLREVQGTCDRLLGQTAERLEAAARDAHQAVRTRSDARGGVGQMLGTLEDLIANLAGGRGNAAAWLEGIDQAAKRAEQTAIESERGVRELVDETESLARASESAASIGIAVAGALTEVSKQINGLLVASNDTTGAATQMNDALARVHGGASDTAQLSSKVVVEAEKGYRAVHKTLDDIERIRGVTEQAAQRIDALGRRVAGIGDVVKMIQEIAEKTNLLALNASIIAAQAGEHGRGFAVVAQEIKALALRTAASTKQISEQIRGVQDESQRAMDAMASGVKAVDEGFQVALGAGDALGEIRQSARSAQKKTQSIARVIDEQKDASRRVVEAASTLAERAQHLAAKVSAESDHADQLRAGARGVSEAAVRIDRLAREQLQTVQAVGTIVGKALADALTLTRGHKDLRRQVDLLHHGASRIAGLETDMADRLAQVNEAAAQLREEMARLS